jgi:tetratricopeptide (TPR) repeat protein
MSKKKFEQYIEKADESARQGDWAATIDALRAAEKIQPDNAGVLTGLGTCLIQINQITESIPYFIKVIQLAPESAEAQNNLGVAYAFSHFYGEAEVAYKKALAVDPEHLPAWKNLAGLYLQQAERVEEGVQVLASIVKKHPDDVESLLLMADCYESVDENESALTLYKKVLTLEPENPVARKKVLKLTTITLGLDETKRADLVKKLGALKKKVTLVTETTVNSEPTEIKKIGFFAPAGSTGLYRLSHIAKYYQGQGKDTIIGDESSEMDLSSLDLVIFADPLFSAEIIKKVNACNQTMKPFVIDIDQDYFQIPPEHPAYLKYGPGNPAALQALEGMLKAAAWVMTTSKVLAERYGKYSKEVKVFLPDWDPENPLWTKKSPSRKTVNVGWVGSEAERPDLLTIRKDILKLMRAYPAVNLVISGDMKAYESFSAISEKRRVFLPASDPESLPYLLQQIDILIVPLQNTLYNQARSDELLLAAGVRSIPWVASGIPAYKDWGAGGTIVENDANWYRVLANYIESKDFYKTTCASGNNQAKKRAGRYLLNNSG